MLDLLEQQKKLTINQWKIAGAATLGDMLDFFDFFLIGYVLAFIVGAWQLTFLQSGTILLAAGVGAIPGAFFWGWMADRIGRRKVFIATALNFSLATGAMAFTPDQHGWLVQLAGLGIKIFLEGVARKGHVLEAGIDLIQNYNVDRCLRCFAIQVSGRVNDSTTHKRMCAGLLEAGDALWPTVFLNAELFLLQIGYDLAVLVGDHDVENDGP